MIIDEWVSVTNNLLSASSKMEVVTSNNITVCKFDIIEKMILSPHSHSNEQFTVVLEGKIKIKYGEQEKIISKGDVCIISENAVHSAEILEVPFKSYDIFSPIREDFLELLQKEDKSS